MLVDIRAASWEDFCGGVGQALCKEHVIKCFSGSTIKHWMESEALFCYVETLAQFSPAASKEV